MPEEKIADTSDSLFEFVEPEGGMWYIYANNIRMGQTVYDLRISFGHLLKIKDGKAFIEEEVCVSMTWVEAKVLQAFLDANIKSFEEVNGPINTSLKLGIAPVPAPMGQDASGRTVIGPSTLTPSE